MCRPQLNAIFYVSLLIFFSVENLYANSKKPNKTITVQQGLSNNSITTIYQDNRGFMWFGTLDGLNRYDGYGIKVFRNKIGDSASISHNRITSIASDKENNIWIGTAKGLNIYNPSKEIFRPFYYNSFGKGTLKKNSSGISKVITDKNGNLFAGSQKEGLLVYEQLSKKAFQVPLYKNGKLSVNYEVANLDLDESTGSLWMLVENIGLCVFDKKSNRVRLIKEAITSFSAINVFKGSVWVADFNTLYLFNPVTGDFSDSRKICNTHILNMSSVGTDTLWIGTDGEGVFSWNGGDKALPFSKELTSNTVSSIFKDRDGRKWVGTIRGGINVFEPNADHFNATTVIPGKHGLPSNYILSFAEDDAGRLWIGTDGGGLSQWNRANNTFQNILARPQNPGSLSSNFVTRILSEGSNGLWVATWNGGLSYYDISSGVFSQFPCYNDIQKKNEKNIWVIYKDKKGTLWAGLNLLYRFNQKQKKFEVFDHQITNIITITQDKKDNFWAGDFTSLILMDIDHKKHKFYNIGYPVRAIYEDKANNFWIGTEGGGLILFNRKNGSSIRYSEQQGLSNNSVLNILEDKQGNLWLSTFYGLSKFDPKTKSFKNFTQSDGLQSNQFSYNAALSLRSGEMIFGGINGFNIFKPQEIINRKQINEVHITGFKVNNIPIQNKSRFISAQDNQEVTAVRIPADEAVISIDFTALDFSSSEKIKYAYLMEGWDNEWTYVGNVRNANYSRISYGNYKFRLKSLSADGVWSKERIIDIKILPPWFATWWAYLLYFTIILGVIYIYFKYITHKHKMNYELQLAQLNRQKEKELNEKKVSYFTNIAHEFRTPLTLIINPIKALIGKSAAMPLKHDFDVIYRNARRLLSLVDQLLLFNKADSNTDILNLTTCNIYHIAHEVYVCFIQQAKSKTIAYQLICENKNLELVIDSEKIEIVLFNLLSNAFKFTPMGGTISIEISENGNDVLIAVADSGIGIDEISQHVIFEKFKKAFNGNPSQSGFGIGLYLAKHFINLHGGHLELQSSVDQGAQFLISLTKNSVNILEQDNYPSHRVKSALLDELNNGELSFEDESQTGKLQPDVVIELSTKQTILFVDDDEEMRRYVKELFANKFNWKEAENAEEAFAIIQAVVPDLVITDVKMSGLDGIQLCKMIKAEPILNHIPIILLTGTSSMESKIKSIEYGASDYITKPFEKEFLIAKVDNILKSRNELHQFYFDNITLQKRTIKVPREFEDFLEKCIAIIERNIDNDDFNVQQLATELNISHSGLYKKVKTISGHSINYFIRSIRLRRAAVLMLVNDNNVNEAAFNVGFENVRYFREQFHKLFGINPSDYIKKYKNTFSNTHTVVNDTRDIKPSSS